MNEIIYQFPEREVLCKNIGKILKKLRKNQHIKQEDFAIQCQISRNTISLIETGKICPSFDILYRICIVLDINLSDFTYYIEESIEKLK